ncbi:hypothetical protein ABZO31_28545 [Streptomyces sp. HUAS MG47]|uniref:hypothetical protein n=1 Tax=Streptomyces solicamelliae TaxID=3231716 RepID=UPI00387833BD
MDVEEIAEELYGLKPSDFVAARDAYVAEAREAKDPAAVRAIAGLRRPTLAAWAANLLARQRPEKAAQFLTLGEALREAHRTLDAEQLRTASRQRHQLVTALAREAATLARAAGQAVSDTVLYEIEQSLHGVLAHPDVAELWAKGRLVKAPEPGVDFAAVAPQTAPARPAVPVEEPPPKEKRGREEAQRLRDLESARTAAEDAASEVAQREHECGEAREVRETAAAKAEEAAEQVRRLEHELKSARQTRLKTAEAAAEAGAAVKSAESALRQARRSAERADREVRRLERQTGP